MIVLKLSERFTYLHNYSGALSTLEHGLSLVDSPAYLGHPKQKELLIMILLRLSDVAKKDNKGTHNDDDGNNRQNNRDRARKYLERARKEIEEGTSEGKEEDRKIRESIERQFRELDIQEKDNASDKLVEK